MRCMIIDDEPLAVDLLEDNIRKVEHLELVKVCRTANQASAFLKVNSVDLIFCDIQMPGTTGLQLVRSLQVRPMVVFVTAYQDFAIDGFELEAIDYLLKPVNFSRFLQACNKAFRLYELENKNAGNAFPKTNKYLFVYVQYNLIKLNYDNIIFIEGCKDYIKFHSSEFAQPIISRVTFKHLESQLPPEQFFRVHKSFIVNIDHVKSIRKGEIRIGNRSIQYTESYKSAISRMTGKEL